MLVRWAAINDRKLVYAVEDCASERFDVANGWLSGSILSTAISHHISLQQAESLLKWSLTLHIVQSLLLRLHAVVTQLLPSGGRRLHHGLEPRISGVQTVIVTLCKFDPAVEQKRIRTSRHASFQRRYTSLDVSTFFDLWFRRGQVCAGFKRALDSLIGSYASFACMQSNTHTISRTFAG